MMIRLLSKKENRLFHIFTLRILIELAKPKNIPLFVGSIDIEKGFDIVSRLLLLPSTPLLPSS